MARTAPHPLSALFAPEAVAVLGASDRPGRPGRQILEVLRLLDPDLPVHPVTPSYERAAGITCFSDLADAPPADLVIVAGGGERIEADVAAAVEHGARGLLVLGAPDPGPERDGWLRRVGGIAGDAGVPLLGPDTLGFVNYAERRGASWAFPDQAEPGGIAVVSQSGTTFWEAVANDPRLRFSLCAHSGLEACLTVADLIDYALSLESTRVVGLYVEAIKDAGAFAAALEAAADRSVPVVALYAGRSEQSRAQVTTHAGRLATDRNALEGLFRHYGVIGAHTPDEWWTTLALLGNERPFGAGGLAAVMDSGGGLAMFLDYAEELGVPLAELSERTRTALAALLGREAPRLGALDFWAGGSDRHARTGELLSLLAEDEGTAAVLAFTTFAETPSAGFATRVADACLTAAASTEKPIVAATYSSRQLHPELMGTLAAARVPVVDGMYQAMVAARHAFEFQRFTASRGLDAVGPLAPLDYAAVGSWSDRLAGHDELAEADALTFLGDFGVACVPTLRAESAHDACAAAEKLGYPVVLKTDEGIAHKASRGGVKLSLASGAAVAEAYDELAARLGRRVVVAPMADGFEVAVGTVAGPFGVTLMLAAGGTLVELLDDRRYLLAPVTPEAVRGALDSLRIGRVLARALESVPEVLDQLSWLVSRASLVAHTFQGQVAEMDINPVLVSEDGCVAVDALVALHRPEVGGAS